MASATRKGCGYDGYNFGRQGGITNGAAWYSVQGGKRTWRIFLFKNSFLVR